MVDEKRLTPLFSVVIPLYNKADTIERAVRSVAAQSFNGWGLVLVNDGSTDDSLSVVRNLAAEIPMRIIDKPNGGVSSARNAGANAAKGEFIALLDGDDVWYPNHLAQLAEAIEKYPSVRFFGTGYERVVGKYIYFTIPWGGYSVKDVYSAYRYAQPIHTSTVAIEKDLWQSIGGFDKCYSFYEDYEFFFRLGLHTKCCVVRKISARYTDDAFEQLTKKHHQFSPNSYPHFVWIEKMLSLGHDTMQIREYITTSVKLYAALRYLGVSSAFGEDFKRAFPRISSFVNLTENQSEKSLKNWLLALVRVMSFRMRNHLIIWRKKVP